MSKDPCRPHTGNTQWSMWVCLLTWDCLLHYNFHNMAYKKMFNLIKWGVELKMNWLNWSIPISSGFQFQFNSNSKSFNSIPIQFMLNWIELIINSNSIHELIRALIGTSLSLQKDSSSTGSEVLTAGLGSSTFRSTWVKYKYFFIFASTSTSSSTQSTWKTSSTSSTFSIKYESSTSTLVTNNSISRSTTDGLCY